MLTWSLAFVFSHKEQNQWSFVFRVPGNIYESWLQNQQFTLVCMSTSPNWWKTFCNIDGFSCVIYDVISLDLKNQRKRKRKRKKIKKKSRNGVHKQLFIISNMSYLPRFSYTWIKTSRERQMCTFMSNIKLSNIFLI